MMTLLSPYKIRINPFLHQSPPKRRNLGVISPSPLKEASPQMPIWPSLAGLGTVMFLGSAQPQSKKLNAQNTLSALAQREGVTIHHKNDATESPMIISLPQVLLAEYRTQLMDFASQLIESDSDEIPPGLQTKLHKGSEGRVVNSKSSQLARARMQGPAIQTLLGSLSETLAIPVRNMEPMVQVLRYQAGNQMAFHSDTLKSKKVQKSQKTPIQNQRMVSLVIPLASGLEQGGATEFKDEQINNGESLNVVAEVGDALLFESHLNHRGALVEAGEKWALVIWIREKPV